MFNENFWVVATCLDSEINFAYLKDLVLMIGARSKKLLNIFLVFTQREVKVNCYAFRKFCLNIQKILTTQLNIESLHKLAIEFNHLRELSFSFSVFNLNVGSLMFRINLSSTLRYGPRPIQSINFTEDSSRTYAI